MKLQAYLFTFILTLPFILEASHPAGAAAAGAGLSSRALAQEGEFAHTAVGGKRHGARPKDGEPAAKKQKGEDEALPFQYTQADHKVLLDTVTEALIKNDVTYLQTILDNPSAKDALQEDLKSRCIHVNTPAMAQVLANAGCLTFKNEALVFACRNSRQCPEMVQWYIDHGAQVDGGGFIAEIPLLRHIQCSPGSNSPGHPKVRILLQEGALLRPYGNNILEAMRERKKHDKYNAHLLVVPFQEIRLILKQHSDYRHTGIYHDLAVCTTTQVTKNPAPLPLVLQTLIALYYIAQEPTYEELEQEPTT